MTEDSGGPKRRAPRPFDAASLVLVDRSTGPPRFLMGRRHERHSFMPGFMVFPGGRLERSDRHMPVYGALAGHTERNLMTITTRPSAAKARALMLCAIRETCEETGILVGESVDGFPPVAGGAWHAFAEHRIYPAPEALHFVARAVTPPRFPRRFDTRFFVAEASAIARTIEGYVDAESELVETRWLNLKETLSENLAEITRAVLAEVVLRLGQGLERDVPVPFFRERGGQARRDEI